MLLQKPDLATTDLPPPYVEDDDYDVYLFYPSISPRLLIPANGLADTVVGTTYGLTKAPQRLDSRLPPYPSPSLLEGIQTVDELEVVTDLPSPLSPTWSFVSDFVFPEGAAEDVMNVAGYNGIFRGGLFAKSRQFTRRLELVRRKLEKVLVFLKLK